MFPHSLALLARFVRSKSAIRAICCTRVSSLSADFLSGPSDPRREPAAAGDEGTIGQIPPVSVNLKVVSGSASSAGFSPYDANCLPI